MLTMPIPGSIFLSFAGIVLAPQRRGNMSALDPLLPARCARGAMPDPHTEPGTSYFCRIRHAIHGAVSSPRIEHAQPGHLRIGLVTPVGSLADRSRSCPRC